MKELMIIVLLALVVIPGCTFGTYEGKTAEEWRDEYYAENEDKVNLQNSFDELEAEKEDLQNEFDNLYSENDEAQGALDDMYRCIEDAYELEEAKNCLY
jgi:hypothetical protein